jgi:hypothetical protein
VYKLIYSDDKAEKPDSGTENTATVAPAAPSGGGKKKGGKKK